jgi:predicted DNA-binding transcriptional regulator AlpA
MDTSTPTLPRLLLTEAEAGKATGFTRRALQSWRLRGGGPTFVQIGRSVRYRPEDLDAWAESLTRTSTSDNTGRAA